MTTNPIAGNQSYTGVSNTAQQFTELNTSNLNVSQELTLGGGVKFNVVNLEDSTPISVSPNDNTYYLVPELSKLTWCQLPPAEIGMTVKFIVQKQTDSSTPNDIRIVPNTDNKMFGWFNNAQNVVTFFNASGVAIIAGAPVGTIIDMVAVSNNNDNTKTDWAVNGTSSVVGSLIFAI